MAQTIIDIFMWCAQNYSAVLAAGVVVLGALHGLLLALIALFMLIPGEQPEKFLQGVADFVEKYSKK